MKLFPLLEQLNDENALRLRAIVNERDRLQKQLAELLQIAQGPRGTAPQYQERINKLKQLIKAKNTEIYQFNTDAIKRQEAEEKSREFQRDLAAKQASIPNDEKLKISQQEGLNAGRLLRDELGGWEGVADYLYVLVKNAKAAPGYRGHKITGEYLADKIRQKIQEIKKTRGIDDPSIASSISDRTVYGWIQRNPAFDKIKNLLGLG